MRKWTKQKAEEYVKKAKEKGLTYWSAMDYLKHHRTMSAIIQECGNMLIKAKRTDKLQSKVNEYKNKAVIRYLVSKGYECNNTKESMIRINNLLKNKGQKVIIETKNERLSKIGVYYTYEANVIVKIVDTIIGKEV